MLAQGHMPQLGEIDFIQKAVYMFSDKLDPPVT